MISEMDAWKEMQEHAWVVGMSARKVRRESADQGASPAPAGARASTPATKRDGGAGEKSDEALGGLEKRQQEMVDRLAEMDRKYQDLFKLAETAL